MSPNYYLFNNEEIRISQISETPPQSQSNLKWQHHIDQRSFTPNSLKTNNNPHELLKSFPISNDRKQSTTDYS